MLVSLIQFIKRLLINIFNMLKQTPARSVSLQLPETHLIICLKRPPCTCVYAKAQKD